MRKQEYRVQLIIRRKGSPPFDGGQFKTEDYHTLSEICAEVEELITRIIDGDRDYLETVEGNE